MGDGGEAPNDARTKKKCFCLASRSWVVFMLCHIVPRTLVFWGSPALQPTQRTTGLPMNSHPSTDFLSTVTSRSKFKFIK